jgi:hypothetical protein
MNCCITVTCSQVRDRLPDLKAIVQYKGKLTGQVHKNVYDVSSQVKMHIFYRDS